MVRTTTPARSPSLTGIESSISTRKRWPSCSKKQGDRTRLREFHCISGRRRPVEPTKLEKQIEKFKADPEVGVVYTDRSKFKGDEIVLASNKLWHTPREGHVTEHLIYDLFVPFSASMVRKTCLDQAGWMSEACPIAPDYDLWLRLSTVCKFAYVDEILMEYRTGIDSIGTRIKKKTDYILKIQEDFVRDYYGGKFPYKKSLNRAYFNKYKAAGNFHFQQGQNAAALKSS